MIKSKAAILKGLGDWIYDEIEIPEPDKSRAIIRIIKSGICSTDVVRSMEFGFYSYPIVPGHEMLGEIYKLGSKHQSLKEGDKVCVYPLITNVMTTVVVEMVSIKLLICVQVMISWDQEVMEGIQNMFHHQ